MSCSQENCDRGLSLHGHSKILGDHEVQSEGNHGAEAVQRDSHKLGSVLVCTNMKGTGTMCRAILFRGTEDNQRFCLHALALL